MGSSLSAQTKRLTLSGKGIKDLGEVKHLDRLPTVEALERIDLGKNKLTAFPPTLPDLLRSSPGVVVNVTELILRKNKFKEVPQALFVLCTAGLSPPFPSM